jgi:hypothetical protein
MDDSNVQLLLAAIADVKKDVGDLRATSVAHLGVITEVQTKIAPLFDNGQPGVLTKLDNRVDDLEKSKWYAAGALAVLAVLLEPAWHFVAKKFGLD